MASLTPVERNRQDMSCARTQTTFDIAPLRDLLHGGKDQWELLQKISDIVSRDPIFDKSSRPFLSRPEHYSRSLKLTNRIYELAEIHNWSQAELELAVGIIDEHLPIGLHIVGFAPPFTTQGSPELIAKYGELIAHVGILGCYLQTELGHGTNVASLETTATFIPETQEFEIHSPTLTSTKWWVGALAKSTTHGVVQAKLILPSGKDVGPHLFFIQLRSLKDHTPLPGITLGDIGPKAMAGYIAVDNGYARFDHVRIPKENMLSRFAQVTEDGAYIRPPHAKLSYGGMLYIRSTMVIGGGWRTAAAVTISIRYTTVRRQGNKGSDGLERQVITYPSVYHRLLPILSRAYVFIFLGQNLNDAFAAMNSRLAAGDTSLLAEMHGITAGLKVLVSTHTVEDIETARRAMGGHGYSEFAGLGRMYADYLPAATYEGDNFVLDQQVTRAALKSYRALLSSSSPSESQLSPSTQYLRVFLPGHSQPPSINAKWDDPQTAILLLEWRAALSVKAYATHHEDSDASIDRRVSKAITEAFVASQVGEMLKTLQDKLPGREAQVLRRLFTLYLLTTLESALADILSFGLLPATLPSKLQDRDDPTRGLRMALKALCLELLPNAIGLTDAFGFSDYRLNSALGVYDGNAYETLWQRTQDERLNKPGVPDEYEKFIKPILERGQRRAAKLGAKL